MISQNFPKHVVKAIASAKDNITVACDEYLVHTASCLHGDPKDITILYLRDRLSALESNIDKLNKLMLEWRP